MALTDQQEAACRHLVEVDANLALCARAGTGKSYTIKQMIGRLSRRDRVLVVAFNKDIADEMRAGVPKSVDVKTLHALGNGAMKRHLNQPSLAPDGNLMRAIVQEAVPQINGFNHKGLVSTTGRLVSMAMCQLAEEPKELVELMYAYDILPEVGLEREQYAVWAREALARSLEVNGAISFDQMVYVPAKLNILTGAYDYVFFDEAQDGNRAQKRLVLNSLRSSGKATVVYDDCQAIYFFRGASADAVDDLVKTLEADVLPLSVTFRCPRRVVAIAKELVPDYVACDAAPDGRVTWESEADLVAQIRPGHAVIARSNAYLVRVCMRLLKRGMRARVVGRDYAEKFNQLLDRAPGTSVNGLLDGLAQYTLHETERLTAAGLEDKVEELLDTVAALRELSEGVRSVNTLRNTINDLFVDDKTAGSVAVRCMTVHKAKGLQWPDVWVLESSFHIGSDEGRNLYYVAITRTQWTPNYSGHLHLVQSPRRDGSTPTSIAEDLIGRSTAEEWDRDSRRR